jgi:magnesium transporter
MADPIDELREEQTRQLELFDTPEHVAEQIEEIPVIDGAHVLEDLPASQAADVAEALDPRTAAGILVEMDHDAAAGVLEGMEIAEASMVLEAMDPDDRVDILEHVHGPKHDILINEMGVEEIAETRALEQYPPETAGGIMTTQVTALYERITVENAITLLRRLNEELEQMFYVYTINRQRKLTGVLSMRDLILAKPETTLDKIMIRNVRSVPATMDQEQVAQIMQDRGYLAMPVVDDNGILLGLITLDDVVNVIQQEATEDVQRMFGAGAEERLTSPWHFKFKSRIWWLVINLATAFLAGWVVGLFSDTLEAVVALAIYMPIIAGMGGNASAQAMAVAVRGLSSGKVNKHLLWQVVRREWLVGVLSGLVIGVITAVIALCWQRNPGLGLVIFLALLINHTLACTTGSGIPFIMKRLGFDPAQSATIFATTVTDVAGFFSLLGLAKLFMHYLK